MESLLSAPITRYARYRLNDDPCVDIATRRFNARDAAITDQHIGHFRQLVKFNTALRRPRA